MHATHTLAWELRGACVGLRCGLAMCHYMCRVLQRTHFQPSDWDKNTARLHVCLTVLTCCVYLPPSWQPAQWHFSSFIQTGICCIKPAVVLLTLAYFLLFVASWKHSKLFFLCNQACDNQAPQHLDCFSNFIGHFRPIMHACTWLPVNRIKLDGLQPQHI